MSVSMTLSKPNAIAPAHEQEILRRVVRGDREAANRLAEIHRRALYLFALQLTGHREDALDLAQEALFRFFSRLHLFNPSRPVKPFLFRIVRNLGMDLFRRQTVRGERSQEVLSEPLDPRPDPEAAVAQYQRQTRLWGAVNQLKPIYREILILRDYQDLSYAEIAEALNIPEGTVMSRFHKARSLARAAYREQGGQEP